MKTTLPVNINSHFGEPITTTRVIFPQLEKNLIRFRDNFNLFSPPINDNTGITPLCENKEYEVSLIPILEPTNRSTLIQFIINKGGIFTGIQGLLHLYSVNPELLTQHRGMYVVSMINHTDVRHFPRITIPRCSYAPPNFGYHEIHTKNDFYNSTIALLFREL